MHRQRQRQLLVHYTKTKHLTSLDGTPSDQIEAAKEVRSEVVMDTKEVLVTRPLTGKLLTEAPAEQPAKEREAKHNEGNLDRRITEVQEMANLQIKARFEPQKRRILEFLEPQIRL